MSGNTDAPKQQRVLRVKGEGAHAGSDWQGDGWQLRGLEAQALRIEEVELRAAVGHHYDYAARWLVLS